MLYEFGEIFNMKRIFISLLKKFISWHLITIPISALRCEQKKVAIDEGWGGLTIEYFPPCSFYRMFKDGFEKEAISAMEDWYFRRFIDRRLYDVAKAGGGMRDGSLYKLAARLHHTKGIELRADLNNMDASLIREAIKSQVIKRFELLKSIRIHGYKFTWSYISAINKKNHYILIDGHHRVSALSVCGYSSVMVAVSNPMALRIAVSLARKLIGLDQEGSPYCCDLGGT